MTKIEEIQALVATNTKLREERSGWQITGPSCTWVVLTERIIRNEAALTALAEYRNGGLLIDMSVLVPRDPDFADTEFAPGDPAV